MNRIIGFSAMFCLGVLTAPAIAPKVSLVEERTNIRSDRRPIPVGYYDDKADKTFVCWMSAHSHPAVKAFDHASGKWGDTKIVAESPFADKHNYPAILRGKDEHIYMFYGCHNSTLKMAVSPEPNSIEGKWTDTYIPQAERASYPAPVLTDDGVFYVFYRDTRKNNGYADDRPYQFVKSTDNGKTWTRQMLIDPYPRVTDSMMEVYNGQVSYQPGDGKHAGRIHIAWTICGEKAGKHAHATYGRNVYYAYLDLSDDHVYNVEGRDLGTTIDNIEADKYCLALETPIPERGHQAGLQVSVHFRDNGAPLIHYNYPSEHGGRLATWTGDEWHHTSFGAVGEPRGIEKLGPETFRIYSTMGKGVTTFVTSDGGLTVKRETEIETPKSLSRCYVVSDARPELKLLLFTTPVIDGKESLHEGSRDMYVVNDIFE
ncbi:BNR-4 repeat-containing protein [uncultured Duncaniella sp.]|uniref:BNR-4 repeat-containing protein n=1 Tax=uncultured Duncaniella sp. TaxID=2768039 RepID=UPI0025E841DF|nr:BNR-4 repeat-containing protein [uncultured Duncaniella sp.]